MNLTKLAPTKGMTVRTNVKSGRSSLNYHG